MKEDQDDPALDAEDLIAVGALQASDLVAIDRALLSNTGTQWRKVAMVVTDAMYAYPGLYDDIPDIFYAERIRHLVGRTALEGRGNLNRMRFSEVRVPRVGA